MNPDGRTPVPAAIRFWAKVDRRGPDECWPWLAALDPDGYGHLKVTGVEYGRWGRHVRAHRFAYELLVGSIPDGLTLDHLCRNRACVNPAHLEAVTNAVNVLRGNTFPAANAAKTHCPHGHEYTPANTGLWGGARYCKACRQPKQREWHRIKDRRVA